VVDFEAGLQLVVERGARMEESTSARPGTMIAVLGLTTEQVDEIVARWQARAVIANANDNAPGQIVVSGDVDVLREAGADFKAAGARVMDLPVGGAFHSALMEDGERTFAPTLDAAPFADGRVPLVSNFTAVPSTDAATLKAALRQQITGRVRWRESIEAMVEAGADTFVEVGPGKVLSGIVQRCTRGRPITILNVEDPASLDKTVSAVRA
jgi:[acyl-carrier-protein] S-malonyltransferase